MPFNINEFHSQIAKTGQPAVSSAFEAIVNGPSSLRGNTESDLRFRISSIVLPERGTSLVAHMMYGPAQNISGQVNYVPITFDVLCSADFRERDYFLRWQDLAVGGNRVYGNADENRKKFDVGYYDNYSKGTTIEILRYDVHKTDPVYRLKLIDCFPSLIGAVENNWENSDFIKCSVTIAFYYFIDEFRQQPDQENGRRTGPLSSINQSGIGGALGTLGGIVSGQVGPAPAAAVFGASSVLSNLNIQI